MKRRNKKNLPVLYEEGKKPNKFKDKDKKILKTVFGERAKEIQYLVENNNKDGAVVLIFKQLLKMMVDLIPISERVVRQTKGYRGIYQINQMVSQMRELMADMQAAQDRGLLGQTLIAKYVRPAFLDIAKMMVEGNHSIRMEIREYIPREERKRVIEMFEKTQEELAKYINAQYRQISENLIKGLS